MPWCGERTSNAVSRRPPAAAKKLCDPASRRIDALLHDDALVELIAQKLARRRPHSSRRGRWGTPAPVVPRMARAQASLGLETRAGATCAAVWYRAFCRIDSERVPDAKTLIRLSHLLDEP